MLRRAQCTSLSCIFTQDAIHNTSLHLVFMSPLRIRMWVNFQSHESDPQYAFLNTAGGIGACRVPPPFRDSEVFNTVSGKKKKSEFAKTKKEKRK